MADQDDVRRLALELPEVTEDDDRFAFSVGTKGIAWVWLERSAPKAPRVPNDGVLAVRVAGEAGKQDLLAADPDKFFTEPHYNGYPAVLVRLAAVNEAELRELLVDAWRIQAPKTLVKQHPDL
ncbi:hypothetical protein BWI15_35370 [Kribbella sp. ALI-6-A]|uniref:MmcQ/YjbR family DNA-binding protein n=1 Tax=Kribbella sp. ALI-6-A TaxID=1933817 RepID=UPI00097C4474|nr:MmcQ/YjbR family DNA-binding protein [Kribbella sp. ALI-6-A]ONI68298.1 hypothetical protein BWI15_35370 [Kribbella sp. ALI-6-A]